MTDIPPWVHAAMLDAKRQNSVNRARSGDSELGGVRGKLTNKPAPGLSPPTQPQTKVARGELPAPHVW